MKDPQNIVLSIQKNKIVVSCSDESKIKILKQMGAKRKIFDHKMWIITYDSKKELSGNFVCLRDSGFVFAGEPGGWSPSSIFLKFKEEGYIEGRAMEVIWKNKDTPILREI